MTTVTLLTERRRVFIDDDVVLEPNTPVELTDKQLKQLEQVRVDFPDLDIEIAGKQDRKTTNDAKEV